MKPTIKKAPVTLCIIGDDRVIGGVRVVSPGMSERLSEILDVHTHFRGMRKRSRVITTSSGAMYDAIVRACYRSGWSRGERHNAIKYRTPSSRLITSGAAKTRAAARQMFDEHPEIEHVYVAVHLITGAAIVALREARRRGIDATVIEVSPNAEADVRKILNRTKWR